MNGSSNCSYTLISYPKKKIFHIPSTELTCPTQEKEHYKPSYNSLCSQETNLQTYLQPRVLPEQMLYKPICIIGQLLPQPLDLLLSISYAILDVNPTLPTHPTHHTPPNPPMYMATRDFSTPSACTVRAFIT